MNSYRHTQRGSLLIAVLLVFAALMATSALLFLRPLLFAVPVLLVCAWLFHSLTVEVTEGELRWRFGPGFVKKQVAVSDIVKAEVVRTNLLEGWGIHLSRFGWLYNIAGFDAVAFTLKSGKRFAIGTDEPTVLLAALKQ